MALFNKVMAAAALAVAGVIGTANAQAETLRLAHIVPPSHVWHQVAERFTANLEKDSAGRFVTKISPQAKLGRDPQLIKLLQSGGIQFAILTVGDLSNRSEALQAWFLPYTFKDVAHAGAAARTPAAREMLAQLESQGMVGLGYTFAGMRHVLSVKPVTSPDDLRNKKIRSFPNEIFSDWWQAMGAAPTALPLSEVSPSLTTNLLDAVDIDLDAVVGLKFYQQAGNLAMTNHMAFPAVMGAYSAILGFFVPSGGGKWLIEAPYVMQAANELQAHLGWAVQVYNAAEALPNLINPFWMLPLLGVLGLKARDIVGFTFMQLLVHIPLVIGLLWLLGLTLPYVPPVMPTPAG